MQALAETGEAMTPRSVYDRAVALGWEADGTPLDTLRKSLRRLERQGRAVRVGDRYQVATATKDGG